MILFFDNYPRATRLSLDRYPPVRRRREGHEAFEVWLESHATRRWRAEDNFMDKPSTHPAALTSDELLAECDVQRVRRSGPGGQRRNKVETGVVLTHKPTGLRVEASERRSQTENQRVALFRLRLKLAVATRLPVPPDSTPSELWQTRCRHRRISVNAEHDDFPALLAEAMDMITAFDMDIRAAADLLGTTQSQLTRFLKAEPQALTLVNRRRGELGLYRLR